MSYSIWLKNLTDYFFGNHMSQQRVRLMIDDEILDKKFNVIGGKDAFIKSMQDGPDWFDTNEQDLFEICSYLHRTWKVDIKPDGYPALKNNAPPFLPYLCLFSYAWTIEGFHAGNFTKRLETIFPNHGLRKNQNMKWCTDNLWKGLSAWSTENEGGLGIFKIDRLGSREHVDISRAQTIFRPAEIELLPDVFRICGLQPEDADDINNIHEALLLNHHSWHYRLSKSLPPLIMKWEQTNDPIAEAALLIMAEELSQWDGEADTNAKRYMPSIKIHRSLLVQGGTVQVQLCVADDNVLKLSNLKLVCEEDEIGTFRTEGPLLAILELKSSDWNPYSTGAPKTA